MKIGSPLPHKRARIEIIPLIDIMFFLLASFMMASLAMIHLQSLKMKLPTAAAPTKVTESQLVNLSVDKYGSVSTKEGPVSFVALQSYLSNKFRINTNVPVYISGDPNATHGMVIHVLDLVRQVGIQNVSFAISPQPAPAK